MPKFMCWGSGFDEEDASPVEANGPREAAERYAERRDSGNPDAEDERVIFVRDGAAVRAFEVVRHMVPEYEARERKGG